jgi:hypothetical protein
MIASDGDAEDDGTTDLDDEIDYVSDDEIWDDPRAAMRRRESSASQERTRRELMGPSERAIHVRLSRELYGEEDDATDPASDMDANEIAQERTRREQMTPYERAIYDLSPREPFSEEDDATGPNLDTVTAEAAEAVSLFREFGSLSRNAPLLSIDAPPRAGCPHTQSRNSSAERLDRADIESRQLRASLSRRNRASRPQYIMRSEVESRVYEENIESETESRPETVARAPRQVRPARPTRPTLRNPRRRTEAEACPASHTPRLARREQVRATANRRRIWQGQQLEQ